MLNIAHRGGAALAPENTIAAFTDAIARCNKAAQSPVSCAQNYGAELDVQLSADGVAIVYHDPRLTDGTRKDGIWLSDTRPRVKDLTLAELKTFDIGRPAPGSQYAHDHPHARFVDGLTIPTLAEVVELASQSPQAFLLLVELKSDESAAINELTELADTAADVVEKAGFMESVIFVGFDWRMLARVKQRHLRAHIWCTTAEPVVGCDSLFRMINEQGGEGWFPHFSQLTSEAAMLARQNGLKLGAWTVNEEEEMRRLNKLCVDAICTDRPDILEIIV
jgi:glycerophosphoryl diester phosphodiesterase